ncbi:MAG: hypothetical protein NC301_01270 [Bacteroides sp.]|nr:hypothetical protein [Bacteroides sp.]MCM1378758.1 hypothetical protein [Bacteroides sp.]MCM1445375.1 hypothetical protein [Prevotella sp.]
MKILEVSAREYQLAFPRPAVVYNSVAFTELNAAKVDVVRRIVIYGDKPLLGLTFGERDGQLRAPFSAPFACFDFNREVRTEPMQAAAAALHEHSRGALLTLPPPFYAPSMNAKTQLSLFAIGILPKFIDWNFHLDLTSPFIERLDSTAAKKLRRAERSDFHLELCEATRAYDIIRQNRQNHGYPLAMTLEQVKATTGADGPVSADFFVLTNGVINAAAAVVYHVSPQIAQVIYWGDVPCPECRHSMNLLAREVAGHYASRGYKILDIGPSSSEGIPSPGLCDFKDSIGCITTPKPTIVL